MTMEPATHPGVWLYRSLCTVCEIDPDARGAQVALAKETALAQGSLSMWSRGRRMPGLNTALALCSEYGINGYTTAVGKWANNGRLGG